MEMVLEESDAGNWVYKGEGAANIILGGCKGSNPHFVGKRDIEGIATSPTKEIVGKLYVKNVIIPLLGSEHVDTGMHTFLKIVRDYMIAATTKYCSLMLSFRPKMDEDQMSLHNTIYLESINQSFDYKAYFIDLDIKPLKKIVDYYELDHKIVSCYTQKEKMKYEPPNLMNKNEYEIIDSHFNVTGNSRDEYVLLDGP
ncbi:hypothetical protein GIB67_009125 [Kingdonia uniflora]|uniref:Inositol-pentakisphosphate 2-kinase n=1 Tax=Kingdonia uniflora TaxID=39325 RepID=A0A7J7N2T9_9MAGN|nr:hypothetical protein GIB67_009125 [Kingdonia uniflora]